MEASPTQLGAQKNLGCCEGQEKKHVANLEKVDGWNQFQTTITRWKHISTFVMNECFFNAHEEWSIACKDNLGSISSEFTKYIWLYMQTHDTMKTSKTWMFEIKIISIFFETSSNACMRWLKSFLVLNPPSNLHKWRHKWKI